MSILDNFYLLSGQEVSREKTSILFSKNVDIGAREVLVNLSGYKEVHTLGKFLPWSALSIPRACVHEIQQIQRSFIGEMMSIVERFMQ
jgi:hypothetical protein